MSSAPGALQPDPSTIGGVQQPPFVQLPAPAALFYTRARRLAALAEGSQIKPYLLFLSGLAYAQHEVQAGLRWPEMPEPAEFERARAFGMPPLDRGRFIKDAAFEATFAGLLASAGAIDKPPAAAEALGRILQASAAARDVMARNVVTDSIPMDALAEHVFVATVLKSISPAWPAGSKPSGLCRLATASAHAAAARRSQASSSAGPRRTAPAIAPVRFAAPCGITCASVARNAGRPRASLIRRSREATER